MIALKNRFAIFILYLLFTSGGYAQGTFSNLYVFGDSMSDAGNLASLPEFEFLLESPYDEGFSNGPRAVEVLAGYLELSADPSLYLIGPSVGTNYAVAGARAAGDEVIDLKAQVARFIYDHTGSVPSDALYIIFIGGNDVRDARDEPDLKTARSLVDRAAQAIDQELRTLIASGAEAILIVNAPDIGALPETHLIAEFLNNSNFILRATRLTEEFNRKLTRKVNKTERDFHIDLVQFDLFSSMDFLMENNDALGFTNISAACFSSVTFTYDPECLDGEAFDQFMFFDEIHPTARVHERTGRALYATIPEPAE